MVVGSTMMMSMESDYVEINKEMGRTFFVDQRN